jgi:CheY-like chemotaxis protein
MNLAINARDAMPSGGKLTLETANVYLDEDYARGHTYVTPGHYVMLAVTDNGQGMDAETQAHVFEPFFTTKELGRGTGLGLSTAYGIVKQSGGHIGVYSEVGQGTTFKVYLPRVQEAVTAVSEAKPIARDLHGSETILVVEDEDMLREIIGRSLKNYGYTVLEARHGGEALLLCERHPEPIHLMLTDVVMPNMNGRELADRLAPLRPDMKVLYMSGYTDNAIVHHGVLEADIFFVQKPFRTKKLIEKIREILGESLPKP